MNENITPQDGSAFGPGTGINSIQLKPIPGETLESFEAFMCYFSLGNVRSLKKVAEKMDLNISTIKEWSAKYHWVDRIFQYTASLFQNCVETQTQEARGQVVMQAERQKQQQERCSSMGSLCMTLGENILKHILLTSPEKIKPVDAIRLVDLGDRLGRSARAGINLEDLQNADQEALKASLTDAINWVAAQKKAASENQGKAQSTPGSITNPE